MNKVRTVYNTLQDDESKKIFNLRLQALIEGGYKSFIEEIADLDKEWCLSEYDDFREKIQNKDVILHHKNAFVILASQMYAPVFYKQLIDSYYPRNNIWYPRVGTLYATNGQQYFDCPFVKPEEDEVFIDCGCFDGATSKQFIQWCKGKYEEIIAFEPDIRSYEVCKKECSTIKNFSFIEKKN